MSKTGTINSLSNRSDAFARAEKFLESTVTRTKRSTFLFAVSRLYAVKRYELIAAMTFDYRCGAARGMSSRGNRDIGLEEVKIFEGRVYRKKETLHYRVTLSTPYNTNSLLSST